MLEAGWLKYRTVEPEWMDDPDLDLRLHGQALDGLKRINALSFGAVQIWREIERASIMASDQTLRVLDIACGGGDTLIRLQQIANRKGCDVQCDGCDISETAIAHAKQAADAAEVACNFFPIDAINGKLPEDYHVTVCSLFLHHLSDAEAKALLSSMVAVADLIVVDDLVRSRMAWYAAWLGTRLLSRCPVVHRDGPQSVAAAFTLEELHGLAEQSGIAHVKIRPRFPFRMMLVGRRL